MTYNSFRLYLKIKPIAQAFFLNYCLNSKNVLTQFLNQLQGCHLTSDLITFLQICV